ncbi:MAG: hypothetical protein CMH41_08590 [Micrococcales bacterium]|nr:hypothetical protein [Micrococcales bacterium]
MTFTVPEAEPVKVAPRRLTAFLTSRESSISRLLAGNVADITRVLGLSGSAVGITTATTRFSHRTDES